MKHLALAIAAVLSLSLVAPAFAQPFADVPADHWAFDAIAELAAKGILEGYPDGTFKGDRAMTRYEMAMALARILARIEAVQKSIPPPVKIPPPEVRRADIDRLQMIGTLMEKHSRVASWGVRTVTGPILTAVAVAAFLVLGALTPTLGAAGVTALRYGLVGVLGAWFMYYGLKAVQLTEIANRVWKRAAEYSLILAERRRLRGG
jgi:hypothetical protein